jgi:hypothetical protein
MDGEPFFARLLPAAVPIAVYLVYMGIVHLRRRPTLVTGRRDLLLLALALAPLPASALNWSVIAAHKYQVLSGAALLAALVLAFAPREMCSWVFYNAEREDVERLLVQSLERMGETFERRGDEFHFPERTLRLSIRGVPLLHNVVVYFSYRRAEDEPAARYLGEQMARRLHELPAASRAAGMPFLTAAAAVAAVLMVEGGSRWRQLVELFQRLFG